MTTIPARQQGVPAAFLPGPQPILPGGDDVYTQKEVQRLTKATQKLYLTSPITVTKAPTAPVDGMIRLARSPWHPVAGQTADAWVYYDATTQTWRYLSDTNAATVAPLVDNIAAVGTSPLYARQDHVHPVVVAAPGGRLTFSTDPRPTAFDSEAGTAVNYLPYMHNYVPIYNGSGYTMTPLPSGGLTNSYTDATYNPAAVGSTWQCYDLFIWSKSGTLTLTRSTGWGASGTRVAPVMQSGYLVNGAAITNGPASGYGTYVGTIGTYNNVSYMRLGQNSPSGIAAGDALCQLWNQYNRLRIGLVVGSAGQTAVTASSTAGANGWYQFSQRVWLVSGDVVPISAAAGIDTGTASTYWGIAIGYNPTAGGGTFSQHLGLIGPIAGTGNWVSSSGNWAVAAGQTTLAPQTNASAGVISSMWMPLTVVHEC